MTHLSNKLSQIAKLVTITACLCVPITLSAHTWHVAKSGSIQADGTSTNPFVTISQAAQKAIAGDTVLIHQGTYREWVSPANGGVSEARRIVYMPASGEEVWLKGSEQIVKWEKEKNGLWRAEVPNQLFGDFNPYSINIYGDWLNKGGDLHLGQVFVDGKGLTECTNFTKLKDQKLHWLAQVDADKTVFHIQVDKQNPNHATVEINVRPTCFFPKAQGLNYITVKGLHIAQAATQWSPPTGEQTGIIGPNWSHHWVIENCEILQSRCVGICLGKPRSSGQNMYSLFHKKTAYTKVGFNREIEAIFTSLMQGWCKENVGSHLIKDNIIHDCGQAGIVGHMGAAFSTISHNKIYHNAMNPLLGGAETAGIKLHAAIDAVIDHNYIFDNNKGLWLDWQAQGTHVYDNVMEKNYVEDIFVEVSHGPTLIYNNILMSNVGIYFNAQGIAFFNNIVEGKTRMGNSQWRYTPYHFAHSTRVKGLFNNTGGDIRFYNNIFLGNANSQKGIGKNGLKAFNCPLYSVHMTDSLRGLNALQFKFCNWTGGNVFYNRAEPSKNEQQFISHTSKKIDASLVEKEDGLYFKWTIDEDEVKEAQTVAINTAILGESFTSECVFDNRDSTPFYLTKDYFGRSRNEKKPIAGPLEKIQSEQKVF